MSSLLNEPVGSQATSEFASGVLFNTNVKGNAGGLTHKQQLKQDALDLAEVIYDLFKESESSATIGATIRKDDDNA